MARRTFNSKPATSSTRGARPDSRAAAPRGRGPAPSGRGPAPGRGAAPSARGPAPAPRGRAFAPAATSKPSELESLLRMGRWVIGIHAAEEALKVRPGAVRRMFLRDDWKDVPALEKLAQQARANHIEVLERTGGQIDGLLSAAKAGGGNQGVLLILSERPKLSWEMLKETEKCVLLALDGLEDPQNLGSILRTAWLMNVSGILVPQDRAASLTPTVAKIASGGAEHVPVDSVSNLGAELKRLKEAGFWVFGLSEKGDRTPWDLNMANKIVWVVGSEATGLRVTTENFCDELVRIPQIETGSSYNASIAVAMALSETCRQIALT